MITIIDYGMGNLGSIENMLVRIGAECRISSDPADILGSDKLILPGVGHFGKAMRNLEERRLLEPMHEAVIERKIPVLGICLGMQLLTRRSDEATEPGLGWIDAEVLRIEPEPGTRLQVPHMGWNTIDVRNPSPILDDRYHDSRYYFVHSFRVFCDEPSNVLAATHYGREFHSAIIRDHIMGVQFHPEKSHKFGYRLLANFARWGDDELQARSLGGQLFSRTDVQESVEDTSVEARSPVPVRVIPTLLLRGTGLVKTVRFKDPTYVGDPRNAVKIFNEKEVDELAILDIEATEQNREPNYALLEEIITEAFMPIAYGGAIRTLEQARRLLAMGVEKVLLNTAAIENPDLIREASETFGAQSVVVVVDVRKGGLLRKGHRVAYRRGKKTIDETPAAFARRMQELGAGEILLQSIDQEGTQQGYDLELIRTVTDAVDIPVIASGGARGIEDFERAVKEAGASAVAAGSLFVFQGKHRAVLINYPKPEVLRQAFMAEN